MAGQFAGMLAKQANGQSVGKAREPGAQKLPPIPFLSGQFLRLWALSALETGANAPVSQRFTVYSTTEEVYSILIPLCVVRCNLDV